jgi:hypothetical protein
VEREITRCTRELVPMGLLLLLVFSRPEISLDRPTNCHRSTSTLVKDEVVVAPLGCSDNVREYATLTGVAVSSGSGATHHRSSSSRRLIHLCTSRRSRVDITTDVLEEKMLLPP